MKNDNELAADMIELGEEYIEKAKASSIEFKDEKKLKSIQVQKELRSHQASQRKKKELVEAAREKYNHIYKTIAKLVMNNVDLIEAKKELNRLENEYDDSELMFRLNVGESLKKEPNDLHIINNVETNTLTEQVDQNDYDSTSRIHKINELVNKGEIGIIKRKI